MLAVLVLLPNLIPKQQRLNLIEFFIYQSQKIQEFVRHTAYEIKI